MLNNSKTTICTHSGMYFDFQNPAPEMIVPHDIAHALSNICRFGGHVNVFSSVAQHSILVCRLVKEPRLKLPALLHDGPEYVMGDMVTGLKKLIPEFRAIEYRVLDAIAERFGFNALDVHHPSIKAADAAAMHIERNRNHASSSHAWHGLKSISWDQVRNMTDDERVNMCQYPLSPHEAKTLFLSTLAEFWHEGKAALDA